jgi:hypothetical protein
VEHESPLDVLARQVGEAEARRAATEEKLNRTPSWRFRRRAQLRRRMDRRLTQERELMGLVELVAKRFPPSKL